MRGMKPQGQTSQKPRFTQRFEEECGRWRLRSFLCNRMHVIEGDSLVTYSVSLSEGRSEDELYSFAMRTLCGREFPPVMPEAAGTRALELFRAAESEGLVSVVKVHSGRR